MHRAPRTVPRLPTYVVGPAAQAESCSRRAGGRLGALLLVLALGNACASGPRTRSFVELPDHVKAGDTVRLTEVAGPTLTGRAENLSSASLTVLADSGRRERYRQRSAQSGAFETEAVLAIAGGRRCTVGGAIVPASFAKGPPRDEPGGTSRSTAPSQLTS